VATDDGSDFPAEAVALPDVATFSQSTPRRWSVPGADLVVAGGLTLERRDHQVASLGIPSVVYARRSMACLTSSLGPPSAKPTRRPRSLTACADMKLNDRRRRGRGRRQSRRLLRDRLPDGPASLCASRQSFRPSGDPGGADAITTGDPNTYQIPLEKLIERDPQVIILGVNPFYSPTPTAVAARPGWNVMTAVKDDKIRPVNDIEITRPGPRLAAGLRALTSAIWPDISLPPAPSGG
jgi:hypothetical protein